MMIVGGVLANLGLRHGIGKRVESRAGKGNKLRVTKAERVRLGEILSQTQRAAATRRAKEAKTAAAAAKDGEAKPANASPDTTWTNASEPIAAFLRRVAVDDRVPASLRLEAIAREAFATIPGEPK